MGDDNGQRPRRTGKPGGEGGRAGGHREASGRGASGRRGPRGDARGGTGARPESGTRRPARAGADRNVEATGPRLVPREGRKPEPAIPDEVTGKELDRAVHQQLRTLSKENADGVAKHLVMAAALMEADDLDGALAHAETAARRAGRVPAAREALGLVAYRLGDFARALSEFRTVRRLGGSSHLLPLMVDCERGLGRHERALELASSPEAATLGPAEALELTIVRSGIRLDLGQAEAARLELEVPALRGRLRPELARLYYAYADVLLALDRVDEAREWFGKAAEADVELTTDADDRLAELEGVVVIEEG